MRSRTDLSRGWEFVPKRMSRRWLRSMPDQNGESVDLPHCWNDHDTFQEGVPYRRGHGSYRRAFDFSDQATLGGMIWTLDAEGFYGTGDVWLNGQKLGDVDGQYLGFSFDAGKYLVRAAENIVGIRLTNKCRSHVLPGIRDPDFLLYGGLAGRMYLMGRPGLSLDSSGTYVVCRRLGNDRWELSIHAMAANSSRRRRACSIRRRIVAPDGGVTFDAMQDVPDGNAAQEIVRTMVLDRPQTWSCDAPNMHTAEFELYEDGFIIDSISLRFGIREALFCEKGFLLNGERIELRGCNRHESMPGFGNAMPACLHREDAALIRSAGLNFVRLSHYPQHPAFLDACDEMGILVYAEIATWKSVRTGCWLKSACRQMRDMIRRDRNHPSIVVWGMGNESRSRKAYEALREVARQEDPTRPATYAENHLYRARREKTLGLPDVWACNYELDAIDEGRDSSRLKCVIVSECSNYPFAQRGDADAELTQVRMIEDDLAKLRNRPYVAGFSLWSFNDYATMRKKRYKRHCGIFDAWRTPKMSVALMQAMFSKRPFVRVFGDWGLREGAGKRRAVHIFTNCDRITLTMNGKTIADLKGAPHVEHEVEFEPSELIATGEGRGGQACDRLVSFGEPADVDLALERAPAESIAVLSVRILDGEGRLVSDWNGEAELTAPEGAVVRSHKPDGAIPIRSGIGRAFLRLPDPPRETTIRAICAGIASSGLLIIAAPLIAGS